MRSERECGTPKNTKNQDNTSLIKFELEQLTIAIEKISLKRKESERRIKEEKEALKGQEKLLELYTARVRKIIQEQNRGISKDQSVTYDRRKEAQDRKTTHYFITGFNTDKKRELFIGDRVFTNNGSGKYKGLRVATVISPLPRNRVKLQFDGFTLLFQ